MEDKRRRWLFVILLVVYVLVLFCSAVVCRQPHNTEYIHTDLFWGFRSGPQTLWGNLINIGAFVPVGLLVGLLARRRRLLLASLAGLFLSETFECFQLILHRGVFDVDDLFNNVVGALIGGLIAVVVIKVNRVSRIASYL